MKIKLKLIRVFGFFLAILIVFVLIIASANMSFAQANLFPQSFEGDIVYDQNSIPSIAGNCSSSPEYNHRVIPVSNIPWNSMPVKKIIVDFNVIQDNFGARNFQNSNNQYAGIIRVYNPDPASNSIFEYLNDYYKQNYTNSSPPSGVSVNNLTQEYIQFELGGIYYYKDPILWRAGYNDQAGLFNIVNNDLSRPNVINKHLQIFLTEGFYDGAVDPLFVKITNGGSGYTSQPIVTFTPSGATGTAIISGGAVTGIQMITLGHYQSNLVPPNFGTPTISFTGGGGSGATAMVGHVNSGVGGYAPLPTFNLASQAFVVLLDSWRGHVINDPVAILNNLHANDGDGGKGNTLAHEMGHNLDLSHTYISAVGGGSPFCSTVPDPYFLDDVFGVPGLNSTCPHNSNWTCTNWLPVGFNVDNNMLGGAGCAGYFSPKQIGIMHSALRYKSVRKYLKECYYDPSYTIQINSPEVWNMDGIQDADLNIQSGATLTLDCNTSMPQTSKIVVQSGATLFIDSKLYNYCDMDWDGTIDVMPGGILHLKSGAEVRLKGNGKILIEEGATMKYDAGAHVYLNGLNTMMEIKGMLNIGDNANFTFYYNTSQHGYVKFSNPNIWPLQSINVTAGNNCRMTFNGSMKYRKMLEIAQETLYGPNKLVAFSVTNGTVVLHTDSRLQPPFGNAPVIIENARLTSDVAGVNNNHRGVHLYGQSNVTINNSTFEYGRWGVYGFLTYGGAPMKITNCIFRKNTNGIYTHDKGLQIVNCKFYNNEIGWNGDLMSFPCRSDYGTVGGTATASNSTGYIYNGGGTSPLWIEDPFINWNRMGVKTYGSNCNTSVHCGSVSYNLEAGFYQGIGSRLTMDANISANNAQVTAINNQTTIQLNKATYFSINKGANELTPLVVGNSNCVKGTLSPTGVISYLACHSNKWNNTSNFSANDYYVFNNVSGSQIQLDDQSPLSTAIACGQGIPQCPNPPCNNQADALSYCPSCDIINTDDFVNDKLNDATKDAIAKMKSGTPDNYIEAVNLFKQILMENYVNPDDRERFLLDISYNKMLESLGNAFLYEQVKGVDNTPNLSSVVGMVIEVQNRLIADANAAGNYYLKFFTSMDKANVLRLADRRDLSITLLNDMDTWVQIDERVYYESIRCNYDLEQKVLNREITIDDFSQMTENCGGNNSLRTTQNSTESNSNLNNSSIAKSSLASSEVFITISPNPVVDILSLITSIEAGEVQIFNSVGAIVLTEKFYLETSLDLTSMPRGIYLLHFIDKGTSETFDRKILLN